MEERNQRDKEVQEKKAMRGGSGWGQELFKL